MTDKVVNIAVFGAAGRMGKLVIDCAASDERFKIVGAVEDAKHPKMGRKISAGEGEIELVAELPVNAGRDVVGICFADKHGLKESVKQAVAAVMPLVIGSTGLSEEHETFIYMASNEIPILQSANFSVGVNVLLSLIKRASAMLNGYEIEIVETHHDKKIDAPSGTAVALGRAAAAARGVEIEDAAVYDRKSVMKARTADEIGFSSIRGGDVVGEHDVIFFGKNERVILAHRAHDRAMFARGALDAAFWLCGKPAGLYSMNDVLGLEE